MALRKRIRDKGNKVRHQLGEKLDNTVLYKRDLDVGKVRSQFQQKLVDEGLSPEQAEKSVYQLSKGDVDQVSMDLRRHPSIMVINESTGKEHHFTAKDFDDTRKTELFLRALANNDQKMYDYLSSYLHQGGFLHLSELLITYYFAPDTRFSTDNRAAIFTIKKNSTITFEEKFDIQKVATDSDSYEKPSHKSIASISLKSIIRKDQDNTIKHYCSNMKVKARDEVASKFFSDPRGPFQKCVAWIKDAVSSILNHAEYKTQATDRNRISKPGRNL